MHHCNYLSSQLNTKFNGNSNNIVNNPVTSENYHPYDTVELEKETNYPPGAGKRKKHHDQRGSVAIDFIADDHARSTTCSKRKTILLKKVKISQLRKKR